MGIDYNAIRYSNSMNHKKFMQNLINKNMSGFIEILLNSIMYGHTPIVKMLMPSFENALNENELHAYDIATLIYPAACMNSTYAMDMLLRCYSLEPHKCTVPLTQAITSYCNKQEELEKIPYILRYQIAFCYMFGIGVPINHKTAMEFLDDPSSNLWEIIILKTFLRVTSDFPSIHGNKADLEALYSLPGIIKDKEPNKHRRSYLITLCNLLWQSNIGGRLIACLGFILKEKPKVASAARISINLFNAYQASLEWRRCLNNNYCTIDSFSKYCEIKNSKSL